MIAYDFKFSETVLGTFRVGVLNILDRENTINRYYEVNPEAASTAIQIDNKSLGLTPNISFRLNF